MSLYKAIIMAKHSIKPVTRREMLQVCSGGFGMMALAGLLSDEAKADAVARKIVTPLSVKAPMFPAKAKRVIFLFMQDRKSVV